MKSKRLLLMLLLAVFGVARAQVTIGDLENAGTDTYLPMNSLYENSYTQQIYTADEIGTAGTINAITVWLYNGTPTNTLPEFSFDIYMLETDKEALTDWESVSTNDIVYSGTLTVTNTEAQAYTFTLDNPFSYSGDANLLIAFDNHTGSWRGGLTGMVFTATDGVNRSIYARRDNTAYTPTNMSGITGTLRAMRNVIEIDITAGSGPSCPKPKNLAVNYEGGTTATVTWTGDATLYNIDVNGTVTNDVTSPYTLSGLEFATTYTVKVQANCGDRELSDWTNPVSFTTDLCAPENMCELTYELADSYGDGWNGNSLSLVDVATQNVIATLTISSGSSANGTIAVCDGREIQFVWAGTSWPYENSFTIYDINGEIVCQHVLDSNGPSVGVLATYTVSCTVSSCRKPTNLTATEVSNRTATLSWTENGEARAWNLLVNGDLIENVDNPHTLTGLTPETTYTVQVSPVCEEEKWSDEISFTTLVACPAPTELAVAPTPISANVTWNGYASSYNLRYGTCEEAEPTEPATIILTVGDVWGDGTGYQMLFDADATAYGTIIPDTDSGYGYISTDGTIGGSTGDVLSSVYDEFEYKIPVTADGALSTENIVINNSITLQIPAGTYDWCITNPTPGARMWIASSQGNIGGRADDYVFEAGKTYEFVVSYNEATGNDQTNVTITCNNMAWTTVNNVTSPYTIEGLTPETEYYLEVQAVCGGEDGESAWTTTTFTTPSNCDAPLALNVPVETLMPTTATLAWTGYQDSFEARYRIPGSTSTTFEGFSDDFESGTLDGWTVIRGNEGTEYTDWRIYTGQFSGGTIPPHSGSYVAMSRSWSSSAYHVCNWLITPQVSLEGELSYWVIDDGSYHEHYDIYVSTTTADTTAFSLLYSPGDATDEWTQHTVDLSSYAGQQGYIAFRHQDYDQDYLFIDDVLIGTSTTVEVPAGEWITVTSDGTTVDIEELDPETTYEWQVRGENRSCTNGEDEGYTPWSEMGTFTTPGLCDNPNTFTFETLEATTATVNWIGYQDSYNVLYRTAELGVILAEDFSNGGAGWSVSGLNSGSSIYILGEGDDAFNAFGFAGGEGYTQYLISPEMEASEVADSLTFFYYGYQGSAQAFKVGYSSTDSEIESFTWGDEITTNEEDFYGYYEGLVPAGTKYFAIQSTGTSSYLFVTDFYVIDFNNYVAPGEWVELTVNESSVTMEPLVPETVYEVYVQGICGEGEEDVTSWIGGYFMTPELTTVTQTIALGAGVNWISVNVETDLDALKAALEATGNAPITIQSKDNGLTTYNGTRWRGTLNTLDVNQMYMITVDAACEITLEGMPINPEEHPITIHNGANWIAFPLAQSMALSNAFAGFNAASGDVVNSKNSGLSTYNGTRWRGQLTTLVPGEGYIYNSTAAEDKTLIFPANTSKAAQNGTLSLSTKKTMQDKSVNLPVSISLQKTSTNAKPENKSVANKEKENFAVAKKSSENCKSIKK